jgi:hypothetical protein
MSILQAFRNKGNIHILVEMLLLAYYENRSFLFTSDIKCGTFDVCNKSNVIVLFQQNNLKLLVTQMQMMNEHSSGIKKSLFLAPYIIVHFSM